MARTLPRAATVAALFLILLPGPAFAHAAFVSGTPGPGDDVSGSLAELVIEFSQDLDPSRTSLEIRDASGASVARGGELGVGPREFRLAVPQLVPGKYEVRWTSFSAEDGELARGSYAFTVVAAASLSPSLSPSPTPSLSPSLSPTPVRAPSAPSPTAGPSVDDTSTTDDGAVLIPVVVALLIVGGIGFWLVRRRAT